MCVCVCVFIKFIVRNWLGMIMEAEKCPICHLQAGDPRKTRDIVLGPESESPRTRGVNG